MVTFGKPSVITTHATTTIGFTGDAEILVKLGFSWGKSYGQTSTFTVGTDIPGWWIWGRRPYIQYRKDFWQGTYAYTKNFDHSSILFFHLSYV